MSHKCQPVRGTHDILPEEAHQRAYMQNQMAGVARNYGFGEIITPMFEFSDVFHRTLGDTSDVVTKETYTFEDRGGESITLRPEFTAAVVRAFLSNGMQDKLPFKVFYYGPAFRYERPQKGRLRQFHQFGVELLGQDDPSADVEVIALADQLLTTLGLRNHVTLEINTLGDMESRNAYRTALVSYFNDHKNNLSEDSRARLEKNPLRILDSKDEGDKKLVANAPNAAEYYTQHAAEFYAQVKSLLAALGIAYKENNRLVRGLDYYQHTVFEYTTEALGAQGTVLAGGRYDGLVKLMGGPDIAGIGFAAGVERLLALSEATGTLPGYAPVAAPIAVIPLGDEQLQAALQLAQALRKSGPAEIIKSGNMSKRMKKADKLGARFAVLLGEDEMKNNSVVVKDLSDGSQQDMPREKLADFVAQAKDAA